MLTSKLIESTLLSTRLQEGERFFRCVSTDTRSLQPNDLFVPLVGEIFNGHTFIQQAIKNGAAAALWAKSESIPDKLPDSFQLYIVEDTLVSLQQMAKNYREQINPNVIAITGSNGKTTTKDIVYSLLSSVSKTIKTQGNYNNHIGLPLTILSMPVTCEFLILEMGMSGFGEIELLSHIASPNEAIVTNIGESHMEQLGSREGIAKAKMEILAGLQINGNVYLDGDEPLLVPYYQNETIKIGFAKENEVVIEQIHATDEGFRFKLEEEIYSLPLLGEHNVKNATYAIVLAKKLGLSYEQIQKGLSTISLSGMRLEKMKGQHGELIINDAYNASPTSMMAAVNAIKHIPNYQKRIIVLGDMYELGANEEKLHRSVAGVIDGSITHFVAIGEKGKWIFDEWKKHHSIKTEGELFEADSLEKAARHLAGLVNQNTVVLFKASRGMKLEQLIDKYQAIRKEEE
ncbi:UDP-N-acetylmuramoyl-tripeptide--D-alanyl-D-alanine ligase [Bacillus solitudinis]|uniref:UDP-N-acetylmuramoyl-tripeptide--D-alanyl-D- alanine ligase n=1 Tax=Bacillus solitudinis TaxID=2014074 RepID=UPI000C24245B|nr:UDP-N-acetylmuramoyl-tripeptide--D-alanyl-D-alanine ligase [Bacillus solitudinis]